MVLFWSSFWKIQFFPQKRRATFFAYSTAFWLDFQGLGASKTWKKQQKRCLGNHGFLREWKSAPELGFSSFFVIFGLHFGAPGRPKIEKIRLSLCFSVRRALWIVLGPLWAPFWSHFGVILSLFLMDFRRFSVRCPILFERCSGVACSC